MQVITPNKSKLAAVSPHVEELNKIGNIKFSESLRNIGLFPLQPTQTEILQINLGKLCNQTCEHCHVDAGPNRKEIMDRTTLESCLSVASHPSITTIDLTGGAPEMNPDFRWFVSELRKLNKSIIVRSNLTILTYKNYLDIPEFFKTNQVKIISSLPCYTKENVDKQRGNGVFERSIAALKRLNELGYGKLGTGLELNLVYNPGGASLPPEQGSLELDYKRELKTLFNIEFNNLYTITNLPINRFLDALINEGKLEEYMDKLIDSFNPIAANNVMCRNTLSVGWDGVLYDCDFNQMLNLKVASKSNNINNFDFDNLNKRNIVLGEHCYGCTAGAGSSCQGSLTKK